jgi:carboxyl-terminal processing protease
LQSLAQTRLPLNQQSKNSSAVKSTVCLFINLERLRDMTMRKPINLDINSRRAKIRLIEERSLQAENVAQKLLVNVRMPIGILNAA